MRPAALLGLFAVLAACGGAAVEGPRGARNRPGSPAPGVEHVECGSARRGRCIKEGVDACNEACGDGDAGACLSLASLLERGFEPKLLDEGEKVERDAARALELRRLACRLGLLEGCYEVVTIYAHKPQKVDVRAPLAALERACERDPVCGCAFFGSALSGLEKGARDLEALRVLDGACERGALLACDTTMVIEELCRSSSSASPACATLREQGRVRPPDPTWEKASPPPSVIGCFRLEKTITTATPGGCGAEPFPFNDNQWEQSPTPAPCAEPPARARGTIYCFAPDRYYVRPFASPSWDQRSIEWYRLGNQASFRAAERSGETLELTPDARAPSAGALQLSVNEYPSPLVRLDAREAAQTLAEIARLPKVEDECARAHRCSDAVDRALRPAPSEPEEPSDAPPPEPPLRATTLLGCVEERRAALDQFKRAQPRSEPPPDCRPASR